MPPPTRTKRPGGPYSCLEHSRSSCLLDSCSELSRNWANLLYHSPPHQCSGQRQRDQSPGNLLTIPDPTTPPTTEPGLRAGPAAPRGPALPNGIWGRLHGQGSGTRKADHCACLAPPWTEARSQAQCRFPPNTRAGEQGAWAVALAPCTGAQQVGLGSKTGARTHGLAGVGSFCFPGATAPR